MRPKSSSRFAQLTEKALGGEKAVQNEPRASKRPSILGKRQEAVAAVTSGRVKTVKVFGHDPSRIRAWSGHNRDYAALNKDRCADLIEGFRRADQQFAAVVRSVDDSDDFDYEFICGARRHWTATYLKRDLIVEVRKLTDRDAFLLQDIENRDREDISDYERACDYAKALPIYFENKKSHMAEQLQIDQGNFTRFLALADLPEDIVQAYADVRELLTHHGTLYNKLMKDPATKKRVLAAAKKLKGAGASGRDVVSTLKRAAQGTLPAVNRSPQKDALVRVNAGRAGEYTVSFKVPKTNPTHGLQEIRRELLSIIDGVIKEQEAPVRELETAES